VKTDFSPEALADLDALHDYIAEDKPGAAQRWVAKLISMAEFAALYPLAGRMVPEVGDPAVREVVFRNYRIIYRLEQKRLLVLTVIERHRRLRARSEK
jgi:toxin ParE1/3/4